MTRIAPIRHRRTWSVLVGASAVVALWLGGVAFGQTEVTTPPVSVPPETVPPTSPVTVPPVTVPPVTAPPVTAPPITVPPVTAPPVTVPGLPGIDPNVSVPGLLPGDVPKGFLPLPLDLAPQPAPAPAPAELGPLGDIPRGEWRTLGDDRPASKASTPGTVVGDANLDPALRFAPAPGAPPAPGTLGNLQRVARRSAVDFGVPLLFAVGVLAFLGLQSRPDRRLSETVAAIEEERIRFS